MSREQDEPAKTQQQSDRKHTDWFTEKRLEPNLRVHAPPWKRNPSDWSQRIPICVLAAIGFVIAGYMALYQWELIDSVWDPVFGKGSERVLDSNASASMDRWIGFPDAALGALGYLGDAIYGLAGSTRRWQYRPWMVIIFGLDVIPLGIVSAGLVVVQGTIVHSWCFLCCACCRLHPCCLYRTMKGMAARVDLSLRRYDTGR